MRKLKISSKVTSVLFLIFVLISMFVCKASYAEQNVIRVEIEGNDIVSVATIISKIKLRTGQAYNEFISNEDIKNLYATGFFQTVEIITKDEASGIVVVFKVKEKLVLKKIKINGTRFIRTQKIEEAIGLKNGSFVDEYTLKQAANTIKDLYSKQGFTQSVVKYTITPDQKGKEAEITFEIEENTILKITKMRFEGNFTFSNGALTRLIKTRNAWFLNKGIFKQEIIDDDLKRLEDYYRLNGFTDIKINTKINPLGKGLEVVFLVEEGKRYYIGEITIKGNQVLSNEEIYSAMKLFKSAVFSEAKVYDDSLTIRELYVEKGYIFSLVNPYSYYNLTTNKVDITYEIVENEVAYIERISVRGNTKTKDKVIRRELKIYPGERYDGKKVQRSKEKLENLGFFEEVRFGAEPGTEPDKINLVADLKEARTGYVSFGGGYSSIDELVGFIELRQRNFDYQNFSTFTGGGQDLNLRVSFGSVTERYQLSFTNPWIFDRPISFSFDAYKKGHSKQKGYAYEEDITGGALRLGRQFNDYVKGGIGYRCEMVEIDDVDSDATQELKEEVGDNLLSSGEANISFDSRNNVFSPSQGLYVNNSFQLTGGPFGGDKDFFKDEINCSVFFPLWKKSVIEFRAHTGVVTPFSNTRKVPIYERFFTGGAYSIRGYNERKVGPIDPQTNDPIGGEALFVGNIEYTYPLADFIKIASFFDTGNVWKEKEDFLSGRLMSSVGMGLRVKTPIGPVNLDYGWPLDKEPGKDSKEGKFHFSISRGF